MGRGAREDRSVEAHDQLESVRRGRRVLAHAIAVWVASALLDVVSVRMLGRGTLSVLLGVRAVAALGFCAVLLRMHVAPPPSLRVLRWLWSVVMAGACVSTALFAIEQGTVASAYVHGISVTLVAYGLAWQEPWRRGAVLAGIPVAAFLAVLLGSARLSPTISADLATSASAGTFLQNMVLVVLTGAFVVAGGDMVHRTRREAAARRGLGRYDLRERIARGGMGEVWRAHHAALDREVAVKIIRADRASAAATTRFLREVRALSELKHPSTVRIFDHGVTADGVHFFAMELLEGETLDARLSREPKLAPIRAAEIARDVARGLHEAHLRGIVHRDITPSNVFLVALPTGEELVKVLDFGIAKPRGDGADETSTLTAQGKILGTPMYMAPEQARGAEVDARADVYALGAVLFRMLCGRAPFEKPSRVETLQAHVWDAPPKPSWLARVPPALEEVVLSCLRKPPEERFASAGALADALESYLRAPPPTDEAAPEDLPAGAPMETIDVPADR